MKLEKIRFENAVKQKTTKMRVKGWRDRERENTFKRIKQVAHIDLCILYDS
jgi:hypothetical protein